jgi:hypothetical protein
MENLKEIDKGVNRDVVQEKMGFSVSQGTQELDRKQEIQYWNQWHKCLLEGS